MKSKILAAAFALFVLWVILSADLGRMPSFIHALYDFPQGDRVGHVVIYGIFAALLARAFPRPLRWGRFRLPASITVLALFAAAEECSQSLFSSRTVDLVDLACSFLGISLGTLAPHRGNPAKPSDKRTN